MLFHWTDERRVQRALAGDRQAAARLVEDHYPGLVRFLLHLTGRIEDAEEIAQEAFVRAWQRLDTYAGRASFRTWIHRIAYREFLGHRERRWPTEPLDEERAAGGDFSNGVLDALTIEQAVLALSLEQRSVFLLLQVQGLSAQEVAEILDVPRGTVLSRAAAARERLSRLLVAFSPEEIADPKPPEGATPYEITPSAS